MASDEIDHVIEFRYSEFIKNPESWLPFFNDADAFLTVGDYFLAKALSVNNISCYYIDVLFGIGMSAPILPNECKHIFLMNSLQKGSKILKETMSPNTTIIDPIWRKSSSRPYKQHEVSAQKTLLINFGGVVNPLGDPWPAVKTMLDLLLECQDSACQFNKIVVCGGDSRLEAYSKNNIKSGFLPHSEFLELMKDCGAIMTTAGLAVLCELMSISRQPFLLLPLNYSQYLQSEKYAELIEDKELINWHHLPGYERLPTCLSDAEGSEAINHMAGRFSQDENAQDYYRNIINKTLLRTYKMPLLQSDISELENGVSIVTQQLISDLSLEVKR